jgi:hypothetical protein
VLALILYFLFGWRVAVAEVFGEFVLCTILLGGGGGGRVVRFLRWQLVQLRGRRTVPAQA